MRAHRIVVLVPLCLGLVMWACSKEPESKPGSAAAGAAPVAQGVALQLTVEGMHCTGCAENITRTVSKLDGVQECSVSFEQSSAVVKVDDPARAGDVVGAIEKLGYQAKVNEERGG